MSADPESGEFHVLLTRTSAFPASINPPIWCASCLLIMRDRGLTLQFKLDGKPYDSPVSNLYSLAKELRRLKEQNGFEWIGIRDTNHIMNAVVYLVPAAIVDGTHICQAHVYDAVIRHANVQQRPPYIGGVR